MIGRITGTLLEKNPPQILVDANGVGYFFDTDVWILGNLHQHVSVVRKKCPAHVL